MKKTIIMSAVLSIGMVSCGRSEVEQNEVNEQQVKQQSVEVTSRAGETFVIENNERIISLAPAITQTIVDMGDEDSIIGVDSYSVDYLENKDIDTYDMLNANMEVIVSSEPDVVFIPQMYMDYNAINNIGLEGTTFVVVPEAYTLDDIGKDLQLIADVIDGDKEQEVIDYYYNSLEQLREINTSIPQEDRKTVFFEVSAIPEIYSFGNNVFLNEMVTLAGGDNVFSDLETWFLASEEEIIARNPQYYFSNVNYMDSVTAVSEYKNFQNIDAIKNSNVYKVDTNATSLPNHHVIEGIEEMGQIMHGDMYDLN